MVDPWNNKVRQFLIRQDIVRYRGELARCADLLAFQLGKEPKGVIFFPIPFSYFYIIVNVHAFSSFDGNCFWDCGQFLKGFAIGGKH